VTQIAQEVEEEWVVRLLFSILGIGPIRALRRGNPAPDLVADFDDQQVALEVTEIFAPSDRARVPYQAVENYRQQLLETCEVDWHRHGNPAVEVHVHFNPSVTILKNQIGALGSQLCQAVVAHLPSADGYAELEFDWDRRDSFLPEQVAAIHVVRFPEGDRSHWLGADAGFIAPLTPALLQDRIDRKRRGNYREGTAASWLVIVADGRRISGTFSISDSVTEHRYQTQFDRVFLLEIFSKRAFELCVA
jgi:hypothetical protein